MNTDSDCGANIFLVNGLVVDDKIRKNMTESKLHAWEIYSRFWK